MKLEEITAAAEELPEAERAQLASRLIENLESPKYDVSDEEVSQRVEEGEANPDALVSLDSFLSGLNRRGN